MIEKKYAEAVLDNASKLDAISYSLGKISENAVSITSNQDEVAVRQILLQIKAVTQDSNRLETLQIANLLKDSLFRYFGYLKIANMCVNAHGVDDERTLSDLCTELNTMIGLENVKNQVNALISYQKVRKMRDAHGLKSARNTLHLAFLGNPGTGKTTVARIVGRIYKEIGLLSKGHFLEVSRTDLIAGYQGQTALKVKSIIENAKGGVLFIDEAYSITENDHSDSYGRECLTELTKALEDYRADLVVIVAGYTEPMQKFFESNPGLKSRFNMFIEFDDYSAKELEDMLANMCKENDYVMHKNASSRVKKILDEIVTSKDKNFANGRLIRNMYDDAVMNHAKRMVDMDSPNREQLSVLADCDFHANT